MWSVREYITSNFEIQMDVIQCIETLSMIASKLYVYELCVYMNFNHKSEKNT